jgi:hypothetical protein
VTATSTHDLLAAWELGTDQPSALQAIALLDKIEDLDAARLTPGEANAALARSRRRLFGSVAQALCACPVCDETLEFELPFEMLAAVTATAPPTDAEVSWRLPTLADVVELDGGPAERERRLLERCLLSDVVVRDELSEIVGQQMDACDPLGSPGLGLQCPACGENWTAELDVPGYLWQELDGWARRVLGEVRTLAATFGWSEGEVLSMSSARREFYLEGVA